jgi:hypothetical protein
MKKLASLSGALFLLAIGGGCNFRMGDVRPVKVVKGGGEVALIGVQGEARERANVYMAQQCGGAYEVVEEGEAVIGERTNGAATVYRSGGTSTQSETTQKTEWRIKYACKAGSAATPAAPTTPGATSPTTAKIHEVSIRL